MPRYRTQGNRKGRTVRGHIALTDVNKAITDSQEILNQNIELINRANMVINMMQSSLNAVQYKADEIRGQIVTLSNSVAQVTYHAPMFQQAQSNMMSFNMKMDQHFHQLELQLTTMAQNASKLDEFMSESGVRRTMEELTELSRRYDSIP